MNKKKSSPYILRNCIVQIMAYSVALAFLHLGNSLEQKAFFFALLFKPLLFFRTVYKEQEKDYKSYAQKRNYRKKLYKLKNG